MDREPNNLEARAALLLGLFVALVAATVLLAFASDLSTFAALRVAQGVFMASAFTLTLAWLGETLAMSASAGAFAARSVSIGTTHT